MSLDNVTQQNYPGCESLFRSNDPNPELAGAYIVIDDLDDLDDNDYDELIRNEFPDFFSVFQNRQPPGN